MAIFYLDDEQDKKVQAAFDGKLSRSPLCEDCGKNRSDPPSKLCPGCQAYCEHQN